MDRLGEFFAMGGYASYVWPAFGIVLIVMALLWIASVRGWHHSERTLTSLRNHRRQPEGGEE